MKTPRHPLRPASPRGFSLVEIMVATSVLLIIVLMLGGIVSSVSKIWGNINGKNQRQAIARTLVQYIAKDLQCIQPPEVRGPGDTLEASRLQFLINTGIPAALRTGTSRILNPQALFFQAPVASTTTFGNLAEVGYFVRWSTSGTGANAIPVARLYRFYADPTTRTPGTGEADGLGDAFLLYDKDPAKNWTDNITALTTDPDPEHPTYSGWMADNVIALFARATNEQSAPRAIRNTAAGAAFDTDAFAFDSRKGYSDPTTGIALPGPVLPPVVEVAMVILDAKSAARLTPATQAAIQARLATYTNPDNFAQDIKAFMDWLATPSAEGGPDVFLGDGAEAFSTAVTLPLPAK